MTGRVSAGDRRDQGHLRQVDIPSLAHDQPPLAYCQPCEWRRSRHRKLRYESTHAGKRYKHRTLQINWNRDRTEYACSIITQNPHSYRDERISGSTPNSLTPSSHQPTTRGTKAQTRSAQTPNPETRSNASRRVSSSAHHPPPPTWQTTARTCHALPSTHRPPGPASAPHTPQPPAKSSLLASPNAPGRRGGPRRRRTACGVRSNRCVASDFRRRR